jgi:hypothetical protein
MVGSIFNRFFRPHLTRGGWIILNCIVAGFFAAHYLSNKDNERISGAGSYSPLPLRLLAEFARGEWAQAGRRLRRVGVALASSKESVVAQRQKSLNRSGAKSV